MMREHRIVTEFIVEKFLGSQSGAEGWQWVGRWTATAFNGWLEAQAGTGHVTRFRVTTVHYWTGEVF